MTANGTPSRRSSSRMKVSALMTSLRDSGAFSWSPASSNTFPWEMLSSPVMRMYRASGLSTISRIRTLRPLDESSLKAMSS